MGFFGGLLFVCLFVFLEPVKEPFKHEMANAVAHEKPEVKGIACGPCEMKSVWLVSKWFKNHSIAPEYNVYI